MINLRSTLALTVAVILLIQPCLSSFSSSASAQSQLAVTLSEGWDSKELFVPILSRVRDNPNVRILGAKNRRDMYYRIKVYRRGLASGWQEINPFGPSVSPYLPPHGELSFEYQMRRSDQIRIEVSNDVFMDHRLFGQWISDILIRAVLGTTRESFDADGAISELIESTCAGVLLNIIPSLRGDPAGIVQDMAQCLLSDPALLGLLAPLLGVSIGFLSGALAALVLGVFAVRAISWGPLVLNAFKEPPREDVTFSVIPISGQDSPDLRVTSGLRLLQNPPYQVGQTLTAVFSLTNRGTAPTTLNVVTAGGRGPGGSDDVRDFSFRTLVTINPGQTYNYRGDLQLLQTGRYHFFVAYQTSDGQWSPSVPTEGGVANTLAIDVGGFVAGDLGEPNDSFGSAYPLECNAAYAAKIGGPSDVDYYAVVPDADGTMFITMAPPSDQDYDLYIYDSSQQEICSSRGATGQPESCGRPVTAGQIYYIKIIGYSESFSTASYYGLAVSCPISPSAPTVSTGSATNVTSNSATLLGIVNPNG